VTYGVKQNYSFLSLFPGTRRRDNLGISLAPRFYLPLAPLDDIPGNKGSREHETERL